MGWITARHEMIKERTLRRRVVSQIHGGEQPLWNLKLWWGRRTVEMQIFWPNYFVPAVLLLGMTIQCLKLAPTKFTVERNIGWRITSWKHVKGASQVALVVRNLPATIGDITDIHLIPRWGRFSRGGHGKPLQYSFLENPMDWGAWQATVYRVSQSQTQLKWLSTHSDSTCVKWIIAQYNEM